MVEGSLNIPVVAIFSYVDTDLILQSKNPIKASQLMVAPDDEQDNIIAITFRALELNSKGLYGVPWRVRIVL